MADVVTILTRHLGDRMPRSIRGDEVDLRCPFHKGGMEKSPSFRVNITTGLAFCHTCKQGWNLHTLLKALGLTHEQVSAELAGVELADPEGNKTPVVYLPDTLLAAYRSCPVALLREGFRKDVLEEYEVGWDRQRKRIVFPIRDHLGRLVALQGRNMDPAQRDRYTVYKEELEDVVGPITRVKLHQYVWGLDRLYVRGLYGTLEHLIVVEGVKKALWLKQLGWDATVSLNGSYLSDAQAELLGHMNVQTLVVLSDWDTAGRQCARRFVEVFGGLTNLLIPSYPEGKTQPDKLVADEVTVMLSEQGRRIPWLIQAGI